VIELYFSAILAEAHSALVDELAVIARRMFTM